MNAAALPFGRNFMAQTVTTPKIIIKTTLSISAVGTIQSNNDINYLPSLADHSSPI